MSDTSLEKTKKIKYPIGLVNKMGYRSFNELAQEIGFVKARERLRVIFLTFLFISLLLFNYDKYYLMNILL